MQGKILMNALNECFWSAGLIKIMIFLIMMKKLEFFLFKSDFFDLNQAFI
jgi:hypothetical protein